jgi:hypothetical protein
MLAELIQATEAPMTHRRCFEALDRTMRDILSENKPANALLPFGGKTVVLGGDFRQILPVVRKGSRSAVVGASIMNSNLWQHVTLLKLQTNMPLQNPLLEGNQRVELESFSKWVLSIGDGTAPDEKRGDKHEASWVTIPEDLLIHTEGEKIPALVSEVYPDLLSNYRDREYLASRAIVCPNNQTVDEINKYIVSLLPGDSVQYTSCDTIIKTSEQIPDFDLVYPAEFLNSIEVNNFPAHKLVLKKGTTVMLLQNLNHTMGLCNGTRLLIADPGQHLLRCVMLTGTHAGETVFVPRTSLNTTDLKWPFTLQRRQFPIRVLCDDNK